MLTIIGRCGDVLRNSEARILSVLLSYVDGESMTAWPSRSTIQLHVGLGRWQVSTCISRLVELKLVSRSKRSTGQVFFTLDRAAILALGGDQGPIIATVTDDADDSFAAENDSEPAPGDHPGGVSCDEKTPGFTGVPEKAWCDSPTDPGVIHQPTLV